MKLVKRISLSLILMLSLLTLASCGLESYANKINKKADKDEHYTYAEVVKKLDKDEIIDLTASVAGVHSGIIIKIKGVTTIEELEAKIEAGEKVEGIRVVITANKAVSAEYKVFDSAE